MILQKIAASLKKRDWGTVVLEVLIVVAGIFIGLQVDDWNEDRKDRIEERSYLERMRTDISRDLELLSFSKSLADERIAQIRFLETIARDAKAAGADPSSSVLFLEKASWESYLPIAPRTYEELRSSGLTTLVRDRELRDAFAEYYRLIGRWEVILKLDDARGYFKVATAGLLSSDQLIAVEANAETNLPVPDPDPELAIELARKFSKNEEAVRWLPQMLKYHVLVKEVIARHEMAANELIRDIDEAL